MPCERGRKVKVYLNQLLGLREIFRNMEGGGGVFIIIGRNGEARLKILEITKKGGYDQVEGGENPGKF